MRILKDIHETTYHPYLNVYQLKVTWQGHEDSQDIFLHESLLFRGLEESLKVEDSYDESSFEQDEASIPSEEEKPRENSILWRSDTRPQREMKDMLMRNLPIFEVPAFSEDEK